MQQLADHLGKRAHLGIERVEPAGVFGERRLDAGQSFGVLGLGRGDLRQVPVNAPGVPAGQPVVVLQLAHPTL